MSNKKKIVTKKLSAYFLFVAEKKERKFLMKKHFKFFLFRLPSFLPFAIFPLTLFFFLFSFLYVELFIPDIIKRNSFPHFIEFLRIKRQEKFFLLKFNQFAFTVLYFRYEMFQCNKLNLPFFFFFFCSFHHTFFSCFCDCMYNKNGIT